MIRLVWKAYREGRIWALPLAAFSIGPILFGSGFTFLGHLQASTPWVWLCGWVGFMIGGSASGGEKKKLLDFVRARPISTRKQTIASALAGFGIILAVAVAAGIAFIIFHSREYGAFVNLHRVAVGMGYMVAITAGPFLVALLAGETLASRAGGLAALAAVLVVEFFRLTALHRVGLSDAMGWPDYTWLACGAGVTIAAFALGLRAEPQRRVVQNLAAVGFVVLAACLLHLVPDPLTGKSFGEYTWSNVSPDGRFAIVQHLNFAADPERLAPSRLVRLSDNTSWKITWPAGGWMMGETYWTRSNVGFAAHAGLLYTLRPADAGPPHLRAIPVGHGRYCYVLPSPSHRLAMVSSDAGDSRRKREFVDVETGRKVGPTLVGRFGRAWWQSDTEIGYTDKTGKRHIVRVVEEAR